MRHALFSQTYKSGDEEVTCWWGISGESMTFLVIDETHEAGSEAAFNMSTEHDGRGVLDCASGIRCIDVTGTVVHLTEDCVVGTNLPLSAADLIAYLGEGKYPLSLAGAKSYYLDSLSTPKIGSKTATPPVAPRARPTASPHL